VPRSGIPSTPGRHDIWVEPDGQDRRHVVAAVAALLGLDPRLARDVLESGSPLRRGVRRGEAEYLRLRFRDWGLGVHVEPDLPERPDGMVALDPGDSHVLIGRAQASLGLLIGGLTAFVLMGIDPFEVMAFPLPQGVDIAEQNAAFERWRSSPGVILGQLAMAWIPLLLSGLCGVFAHPSLPASIPAALSRMVGVASLLTVVQWVGTPMVERGLGTGQSSDIQGGLAGLAFAALCISLSAPLSSAVTRRRPPGKEIRPADVHQPTCRLAAALGGEAIGQHPD
jgi:membrane protein YqaA with SNARE-associated domain